MTNYVCWHLVLVIIDKQFAIDKKKNYSSDIKRVFSVGKMST